MRRAGAGSRRWGPLRWPSLHSFLFGDPSTWLSPWDLHIAGGEGAEALGSPWGQPSSVPPPCVPRSVSSGPEPEASPLGILTGD